MEWRPFIVEMTKAVVWPATVLTIALVFRKSLATLISLLRRLKYRDLEAEFAELAREAEEDAATALPRTKMLQGTQEAEHEIKLRRLAEISPAAAITEAWKEVETAAHEAIDRHKLTMPLAHQPGLAALALQRAKLFSEDQFRLYERLRKMRNLAAHDARHRISPEDADSFISLAVPLAAYLRTR